jgi:hypothetical protein
LDAAEKIRRGMERTKAGWKPDHFATLYMGYGFERNEGQRHAVYRHGEFPELVATVARHSELACGYVETALELLNELERLRRERG